MQINHILLPVDGSSYSNNATQYALYLAKLSGAQVTAVCCYEWLGHMEEISEKVVNGLKENCANHASGVLAETAKTMRDGGIELQTEVAQGAPGKILSNLAKSKKYDLIVMGSHGHSDIAGLFLGSVTHKVLNTIYCPVLVVP